MGPCHVIKAVWRRRGTRWDETAFKPGQGGKLPGIRTRRSQFGRFSSPGRKLGLGHKFRGVNRTFSKKKMKLFHQAIRKKPSRRHWAEAHWFVKARPISTRLHGASPSCTPRLAGPPPPQPHRDLPPANSRHSRRRSLPPLLPSNPARRPLLSSRRCWGSRPASCWSSSGPAPS